MSPVRLSRNHRLKSGRVYMVETSVLIEFEKRALVERNCIKIQRSTLRNQGGDGIVYYENRLENRLSPW